MLIYIVLENTQRWKFDLPGVEVVPAEEYLIESRFSERRDAKVFNFCRTYAYQSVGYYVSLLAAARGHKPLPSVTTIQDMRSSSLVRIVSADLDALIQTSLAPLTSDRFELSIYFGRNLAKRYDRLSKTLFNIFPTPLLRVEFIREHRWRMERIRPIATSDIPAGHEDFVMQQAARYFDRPRRRPAPAIYRYDMAILVNPEEQDRPSDSNAIQRFIRAARSLNIDARIIGKDDYGRIAEYDALFIRETTAVNNHTYRFSQRAAVEGLVVIDDPESIVRCTNKVYQAELFRRYSMPAPRTMVVHPSRVDEVASTIGFPCVLKQPDSSFSLGVVKARSAAELRAHLDEIFRTSELAVVQEYVTSEFDWRIGVLSGRALYACKYYMARGHWQIQKNESDGRRSFGKVETLPIEQVPARAVALAVKAASLIGEGLYGVDLKQVGSEFRIIEINDNPSIEAGVEDAILKDDLYLRVMRYFSERLERRGRSRQP
jgi:glutathione synthase/RimK-type ligase-like ATP-grasp enzyme